MRVVLAILWQRLKKLFWISFIQYEKFRQPYRKVLEISYRFQNIDILRPERLKMLVELFDNRKMREISQALLIWIEEENVK